MIFPFPSPLSAAKNIQNAYNTIAEDFSQTRHSPWPEFEHLSQKTPQNAKILDIGCGNGRLFSFFQKTPKDIDYFGIDPSLPLLNTAKGKNISERDFEKRFQVGSFLSIPFEKETFHEVWAIASFHHLGSQEERRNALQKISSVLKENGRIVLSVWNLWEQEKYKSEKQKAYLRAFLNPLWGTRDFIIPFGKEKVPRYYYSFPPQELKELLQETGFEEEECFFSEGNRNFCITARKRSSYMPITHVANIPFHLLSFSEATAYILKRRNGNEQRMVFTPNPEMLVEAQKNKIFKSVLQSAHLSLPDGTGVLWASGREKYTHCHPLWKWIGGIVSLFHFAFARKWYERKILSTICGSDIFLEILKKTLQKEYQNEGYHEKIFLLGGAKGSAEYIAKKYPAVAGHYDGAVTKETTSHIIEKIKESEATLLFVALGAPKQELWIAENLKNLPRIECAMGVGGSFDFLSGYQKRAPYIFRKMGIEWAYRLFREPQRAKRIWNATGKFIALILGPSPEDIRE